MLYLVTEEIQSRLRRGDLVHASVCEDVVLLSPLKKRQNFVESGALCLSCLPVSEKGNCLIASSLVP